MKRFADTMQMKFLLDDKYKNILDKYNKIWNELKKFEGFDTKPAYFGKISKTKTNLYENVSKTCSQDNELRLQKSLCMAHIIILVDSFLQ